MKAYQVFARMSPERTHALLEGLREGAPVVYTQALARVSTSIVAEEVLAAYFLQVKRPLLIEWLDAVGLEHEDGGLKSDAPPEPARSVLEKALAAYRAKPDDAADRELLLEAFAAQTAIDWPALEELIEAKPG